MGIPYTNSVSDFLDQITERFNQQLALSGHQSGQWNNLTYTELSEGAKRVATHLSNKGIKRGDHVLLFAKSKPDFAIGFFGISLLGATAVFLDVRLSTDDLIFQAKYSDATTMLCFEDETLSLAVKVSLQVEKLQDRVFTVEALNRGTTRTEFPDSIRLSDVAVMAYTSGTVANPKCVMLTWQNFQFQIHALTSALEVSEQKPLHMLSILPLHHTFEFTCGLLTPLSIGGKVYYANSMLPLEIISFLKLHAIKDMMVVPLFLKALKKGIESQLKATWYKRLYLKVATVVAQVLRSPSARRIIFAPVHKKLGGSLSRLIVGASALEKEVGQFFELMGLDFYQGYGLTETSPVVACNRPSRNKPTTVGQPLDGVQVQLKPGSNEVLVRGLTVMKGYYKNPSATSEVIDAEGWFHTGDIGSLDAENFLSIVGREKDLIVLSSGKKVVPTEVEEVLAKSNLISEICVLSLKPTQGLNKGNEVITAVVVPSKEATDEAVKEDLKKLSQSLSYYKRPSSFVIAKEALPKTSTQKLRRNVLKQQLIDRGINP